MQRDTDDDIAMRSAVNKIISDVSNGETEAIDQNLADIWVTFFQGREPVQSDADALKALIPYMKKYLPDTRPWSVLYHP